MGDGGPALHRTILAVDVEGYGDLRRTTPHRLAVRAGLYRALRHAFDQAGIPWDICRFDDCGDGVFALAPAHVPKALFVEVLPSALAVALRRHNESHPAEEVIRLRMGLHAGEIAYDDHGVTAPSVIQTFRLLDSTSLKAALSKSPGVLSLITSSWFFDEVVRHSREVDAATFRPIRVMVKETNTVGWVSLPDFPYLPDVTQLSAAPRTQLAGQVPRQLPALPPTFTGRTAELAELSSVMDSGSCVGASVLISAFAGVGGIGKTWLALQWAHQHGDRFPDGHLFVDLRGYSPDEQPLPAAAAVRGFLDALGVDPADLPTDPHAQVARYRKLVAGKRMLILLDNAFDSAHVESLLPNSPTCTVIVTSRRHLTGLMTRHRVRHLPIGILPAADARDLLVDRLGVTRAEAEPASVEKLLSYCGGLPLALSIVAGTAQARPQLPLESLVLEIRDLGLDALDTDDSGASLRKVLSWSTAVLETKQARVFWLLGIAPGSDISLSAAAALTGLAASEVRTVMRSLEQASLVTQDVPGRYQMHDLVRQHAAGHCTPEDRDAACRRVVDFYLHTAEDADRHLRSHPPIAFDEPTAGSQPLRLADRAAALTWFQAERACVLAAQRVAVDYGWHRAVWQIAWALTTFQYRQGHRQDQVTVWEAGVRAAELLEDAAVCALARRNLGNAYTFAERYGDGQRQQHFVLELVEPDRDIAEEAHAHYALAVNWERTGDVQRALEHALRARDLYSGVGLPVQEADALNAVGWYAAQLGDHGQGRQSCEDALALFQGYGDLDGVATTLSSLAGIAQLVGDHVDAVEQYRQALTLFRSLEHTYEVANTLGALGHSLLALGQRADAEQVWREAAERYQVQERLTNAENIHRHLARLMESRARGVRDS